MHCDTRNILTCFAPLLLLIAMGSACGIQPNKSDDKAAKISLDDLGSIRPPLGERSSLAFRQSVYPLVRRVTCKNCHAGNQSPLFAHEDPQNAHDQAIATKIVDFDDPEESRMVIQLAENGHNCWTPNRCQNDAAEVLKAINQWIAVAKEEQQNQVSRIETVPQKLDVTSNSAGPWQLNFDLTTLLSGSSVTLTVTVESLDEASYIFSNPKLVTATDTVEIEDIRVLVNGKDDELATDFTVVNATVAPPEALLSQAAMLVRKDEGPQSDQFSLSFSQLSIKK